jgi:predicted O-methyltransferase YrrM
VKIKSLLAIARGAGTAVRDPRILTRLPNIVRKEAAARRFEAEARAALGGLPRCVPVDRLLLPARNRLSCIAFLDDSSSVLDLLLLRSLASRFPGCRYLEIGTFRGESALAVADVCSRVVTLSLADETMLERQHDRSFVAAHRVFSSGHPRIEHLFGDSRVIDVSAYEAWADLLFVDGDHSYDGVANDTSRFWSVRRSDDSPVVWHDAFFSPLTPRWEVLAGILSALPAAYRSNLVHVSNTLCLAWLPDAAQLPTVERTYVPRIAFSVELNLCADFDLKSTVLKS